MKPSIVLSLVLIFSSLTQAADESCKINLWKDSSPITKVFAMMLTQKGYKPVYDDSGDARLNIATAGFSEPGCDDGSILGAKNFKKVSAYAEIRDKNNNVIDSIYGVDTQTESTTFNNPKVKRVSCATYEAAWLNAAAKIPSCDELKEMMAK